MNLAKILRAARRRRKMTMKETAELLGVPVSTYRDWEYGRKVPARIVPLLPKALGVSFAMLTTTPLALGDRLGRARALLEEVLDLLKE